MSHNTSVKNLEAGRRPPREEAASAVPWLPSERDILRNPRVGARRSVEVLRRGVLYSVSMETPMTSPMRLPAVLDSADTAFGFNRLL